MSLQAPFPWFGGKSTVADLVWPRFGNCPNYVEPFFGSGAVLLGRPHDPKTETVNDLDGLVANFWRAIQHDPEETARWADNPVNEADLHARHMWIVQRLEAHQARMMADPDYFDARMAGYWVYGMCSWIGSGFASGNGPWIMAEDAEGVLTLVDSRQLPHLGDGM
ncbi:MAG TPA: DNA adenine methylase, partial [Holophaga sp.]|nr:DNA adenine methylase [Holophaga sp.]